MTDKELKVKILAEIERLKAYYATCGYAGQGEYEDGNKQGKLDACDKIISIINSLPEEPVTEDLKKDIESYCFKHGYISEGVFGYTLQEQVADIAKYFYNLGRQRKEVKYDG